MKQQQQTEARQHAQDENAEENAARGGSKEKKRDGEKREKCFQCGGATIRNSFIAPMRVLECQRISPVDLEA